MAYKALYREYRPQTFDEVVGQQQIVQTLKNSIKSGRIAHAYLFTGPRGTGKTTTAKLIAKALNCEDENNKPCGKCKNCLDIAKGVFPDVIEIDAASNTSVENAREIIDQIKYAPVDSKYKIYIIDEVHMLSSGAFNALLKTIEEPPAHVVFILATTEIQKVPATIISRCQRFDFGRVSDTDLTRQIELVLAKENINYEHGVPQIIARLSDGGVRDSLSILDQCISYSGGDIKCQDVRDIYGVLSNEESCEFIKLFHSNKVNECLKKIEEFDARGIDIVRFTNNLIDIFKELVIYNKTNAINNESILPERLASDLANHIDSNTAFTYIDILMEASLTYRRISAPKSYFELTILKLCNCEKCPDVITREVVVEKVIEKEVPVIKEVIVEKPVETQPVVQETVEVVQEEQPEIHSEEENAINEEYDDTEEEQVVVEEQSIQEETVQEQIVEETIVEPVVEETKVEEPLQVQPVVQEPVVEQQIIEEHIVEEVINVEPAKPILDPYLIKDTTINFIIAGKKVLREEANHIWDTIYKYTFIPAYQKAANLLRDGSIAVAGDNVLLIQMDTEQQAIQARSPEVYYDCKKLLKEMFQKDYVYFTISVDEFKACLVRVTEMYKKHTLPDLKPIKDLYTREECELYIKQLEHPVDEEPAELKLGREIFGDLLEIK